MGALSDLLKWGLLGWLAALAALLAWRLLTGQILLRGLLGQDQPYQVTPERLQMLAATMLSAIAYIQLALHRQHSSALPPAPPELIGFFGASHAIYLTTKIGRHLTGGRHRKSNHHEP